MRVKVAKKPFLTQAQDRWSIDTGLLYVYGYSFYLEEEVWLKIKRFQEFDKSIPATKTIIKVARESDNNSVVKNLLALNDAAFNAWYEELKELLITSGNTQTWQFHGFLDLEDQEGWVKSFVVLSQKSIVEDSFVNEFKRFVLSTYCSAHNYYSSNWGKNKRYNDLIDSRRRSNA